MGGPLFTHTTILCVRKDGIVALGGDGQVTMGTTVMKSGASKVRRLLNGKVLAGFAGSTADAVTLFTRFERKREEIHVLGPERGRGPVPEDRPRRGPNAGAARGPPPPRTGRRNPRRSRPR